MSISRRHFFFGSLALPALAAKKTGPLRPAVVVIVADQAPAWMLGCYGNKQVKTPNIDRLSQLGIRFVNHFACAPAPDPGRLTLLTGSTPMQAVNPASEVTVAKILGGAGYAVQETDSAGAAAFLDSQTAGKPFFLQVNLAGLRAAAVPQKYLDLYAREPFEGYAPDRPAPNAALGKEKLGDIIGNVRKSAAAISAMDDEVGAVYAKLRQKGLADNTLVVFASASGALLGRHGLWDAAQGSNPPNMFDEAVMTPILWSWLGHVPALAHRPDLISAYDFVPTICGLLSIEVPRRNLCGRSYAPLVTGKPLPKKQPWRMILCAHMENADMAREERYKLVIHDDGKGPGELYDLAVDPGERTNQYDNQQFLTIHTELADAISKWKQKFSA